MVSAFFRREAHDSRAHAIRIADGKQLCIFATRLVKLRPIHVTVFTNAFFLERAKREVSSELAGVGAVGHVRYVCVLATSMRILFEKDCSSY